MTAGQLPAIGPLTEREWQQQVTQLAELCGWQWAHWRPAMTKHGWRTPVSGPIGAGHPDLLLAHPGRHEALLVELKTNAGRVTHEQRTVHAILRRSGLRVEVWTPRDWGKVVETLSAPNAEARRRTPEPAA